MKIKPKIYAQFLYEKIKAADASEAKETVRAFVALLFSNNDLSKYNRIIREFEKYYCSTEGVVEAKILSARKLSNAELNGFKKTIFQNYLKAKKEVARVEVRTTEDNALLGGAVVRVEDKLYDASLKRQLISFKEQVKK